MAFGRKVPSQNDGGNVKRTTSYPQDQQGKAAVVGEKRTTSYKNSIQVNTRGYETIN